MPCVELTDCPCCHREFIPRSVPNRCSSCEFDVDERTQIWRAGEPNTLLRPTFYAVTGFFLLELTCTLTRRAGKHGVGAMIDTFFCSLLPLGGLSLLLGAQLFVWPCRRVALTRSGVWICTGRRRQIIPWAEVEGTTDWPDGHRRIKSDGRGIGAPLEPAVTPLDLPEFGRVLLELKAYYQNTPLKPTEMK